KVPSFLPDRDTVRTDFLDYALEVAWFDQQLEKMLSVLERLGELDNTIIVITADNGMAFPNAKASLREYGVHVPLAICGPGIVGNRKVDNLTSLIDLAPTILEWANVEPMSEMQGKSLVPLLSGYEYQDTAAYVLAGR